MLARWRRFIFNRHPRVTSLSAPACPPSETRRRELVHERGHKYDRPVAKDVQRPVRSNVSPVLSRDGVSTPPKINQFVKLAAN